MSLVIKRVFYPLFLYLLVYKYINYKNNINKIKVNGTVGEFKCRK